VPKRYFTSPPQRAGTTRRRRPSGTLPGAQTLQCLFSCRRGNLSAAMQIQMQPAAQARRPIPNGDRFSGARARHGGMGMRDGVGRVVGVFVLGRVPRQVKHRTPPSLWYPAVVYILTSLLPVAVLFLLTVKIKRPLCYTMLRSLVVYITTHCSPAHVAMLKSSCWQDMLASLPRHTDISFYITHPRCAEACDIPSYFAPTAIICGKEKGKQNGAIGALHNQDAVSMLHKYVWVLRLNPDTIVYNTRYILGLRKPHLDAVVATCFGVGMTLPLRLHTDFSLFRSSLLRCKTIRNTNAERDFEMILRPAGRTHVLWKNPSGVCRINFKGVVTHNHGPPPVCEPFTLHNYSEQIAEYFRSTK
jgi:hypothetical protein